MHQSDRAGADNQNRVIESSSCIPKSADAACKRFDQCSSLEADILRKLDNIATLDADLRNQYILLKSTVELISDRLAVHAGILSPGKAGRAVSTRDDICD